MRFSVHFIQNELNYFFFIFLTWCIYSLKIKKKDIQFCSDISFRNIRNVELSLVWCWKITRIFSNVSQILIKGTNRSFAGVIAFPLSVDISRDAHPSIFFPMTRGNRLLWSPQTRLCGVDADDRHPLMQCEKRRRVTRLSRRWAVKLLHCADKIVAVATATVVLTRYRYFVNIVARISLSLIIRQNTAKRLYSE